MKNIHFVASIAICLVAMILTAITKMAGWLDLIPVCIIALFKDLSPFIMGYLLYSLYKHLNKL